MQGRGGAFFLKNDDKFYVIGLFLKKGGANRAGELNDIWSIQNEHKTEIQLKDPFSARAG